MSGKPRFIGSRVLAGLDEIAIDGRAVVECYDRLRDVMRQHAGEAGATLFAEPVLSRSNGSAPSRVDWYTGMPGDVQPLAELDLDRAEALRQTIREILQPLLPVLRRDATDGPLVAACLNLASAGGLLFGNRRFWDFCSKSSQIRVVHQFENALGIGTLVFLGLPI